MDLTDLTYNVIGAAYEVQKVLGPHLRENTYEHALVRELSLMGMYAQRQVSLPVVYKGIEIQDSYRVDVLVENILPIELKAISIMGKDEFSQIMSYLVFGKFPLGYLMNFSAKSFITAEINSELHLDKGIYRIRNFKVPM